MPRIRTAWYTKYFVSYCVLVLIFVKHVAFNCSKFLNSGAGCNGQRTYISPSSMIFEIWITRLEPDLWRLGMCAHSNICVAFYYKVALSSLTVISHVLSFCTTGLFYLVTIGYITRGIEKYLSRLRIPIFWMYYFVTVLNCIDRTRMHFCIVCQEALWGTSYTPCPDKKGATDFFTITFTNMHGFLWFLVHSFANEY